MERVLIAGVAGQGDEVAAWSRISEAVDFVDPRYFRPTKVEMLLSDSSKTKEKFVWMSRISFGELTREIMVSDLKEADV